MYYYEKIEILLLFYNDFDAQCYGADVAAGGRFKPHWQLLSMAVDAVQ
jgi:hypothetical protein